MAPTELLAEQHYATVRAWRAARSSPRSSPASVRARGRRPHRAAIARGDVDLVVGTHALIQEGVRFKRLGLGVIDEQHRFGVLQRQALEADTAPIPTSC